MMVVAKQATNRALLSYLMGNALRLQEKLSLTCGLTPFGNNSIRSEGKK
jgi:hypothetical protein